MHWYIVDETNKNPRPGEFFIVGGLVFTETQFEAVDKAIQQIRIQYGYRAGDQFKFDTNSRPGTVTPTAFKDAKNAALNVLLQNDVRMIVYVVLHDLCNNDDYDKKMDFALNTVSLAYWRFLAIEKSTGVMLIDRDNGRYGELETLFQFGLNFGKSVKPLDGRIKLFGMTNDNASRVASAADIALGAFRYCVNTAGGRGSDAAARSMFPTLARILWGVDKEGVKHVGGYGFHSRPKTVRVPQYRDQYTQLMTALSDYADVSGSAEDQKEN